MRAEPYICIKGKNPGAIEWLPTEHQIGNHIHPLAVCWENVATGEESWQRYADFERKKLRELNFVRIDVGRNGYRVSEGDRSYSSFYRIGYSDVDYERDTYTGRILAAAKFLKAVCEKEGVEWLPKSDCYCGGKLTGERARHSKGGCCELTSAGESLLGLGNAKVSVGDDEGNLEDCGTVERVKIEPARSCGCEGDDEACSECTPTNGHIFFNEEVVPCKCQTVTVSYVHNDDGSMILNSIEIDPEEPCDGKNCRNLKAGDNYDQAGCGCGCHNLGAAGCPGCADNCPDKIRKYGSNLGSPDCYSKQEIDSALEELERRVDQKASQLVGLLQKDTYSREEIDSRFANL